MKHTLHAITNKFNKPSSIHAQLLSLSCKHHAIDLRGMHFLLRFLFLFLEEVAKENENSFSFGLFFVNVYNNMNIQLELLVNFMTALLESLTAPQTVFQILFS